MAPDFCLSDKFVAPNEQADRLDDDRAVLQAPAPRRESTARSEIP